LRPSPNVETWHFKKKIARKRGQQWSTGCASCHHHVLQVVTATVADTASPANPSGCFERWLKEYTGDVMMYPRLQQLLIVVAALGACTRLDPARESRLVGRDRIAIDGLHQQDIDATLSDKADDLAQLWDRDAVRLPQGSPAEVGRDTIYRDDRRWEATKTGRSLS
jgi:hypothetical protein